tara:strand:- start:571 stop:1539 length:969 start_codon:yes stop_codon:yes gene_type:complete
MKEKSIVIKTTLILVTNIFLRYNYILSMYIYMTSQIEIFNNILKEWGYDKVIPPNGNDSVGVDNEGNIIRINMMYKFEGTIPDSFYTFTSLNNLQLNITNLKGGVSSKIKNFTELTILNLSNNNNLIFNISYLRPLLKLNYIEIGNTTCEGDLSSLSNLNQLTHLSLGNLKNPNLVGDLKDILLLKKLNLLYLAYCNITGNISTILNLPNLSRINLSNNKLTGNIPDISSVFGSLKYYHIDLSYNCLTLTQDVADNISKLDLYDTDDINFDYNCIKNIKNFKGISNLNCGQCTSCGDCKPPTISNVSISNNALHITYSYPIS